MKPLSRLDLNLLVALDALLSERSVTRAADNLGLSQPALSASLSRLRIHFDDPILVREGNNYVLSPLALRLADQTAVALESARRVFAAHADWDASEATREFTIYGSDYSFVTVGQRVSALAAERAPGVTFRFNLHNPQFVEDVSHRLRTADGVLIPHGPVDGLPFVDLFSDGWVAVVADDNPDVGEGITMDVAAASPWVFTYQSQAAFTPAGRQLHELGIEPRIDVIVEGFLAMPAFIAGTRRLGLLQARLAPYVALHPGVRVVAPPFEPTPVRNALWWHPVHNRDPEHIWMRSLFAEAGRELSAPAAEPEQPPT
jgi:LysR family nod box-dependent transcriptional activator